MTQSDNNESNSPRFMIPLWAWAAAIVAMLFFALTLWQAQKFQRQLTELQLQMRLEQGRKETLEAQRREVDQIRALLSAAETRAVQVKHAAEFAKPFKLFWNEELGVLVTAQNFHAPRSGPVFQLWIVPKQGSAISAGIIQPDANGNVMKLLRPAASIHINEVTVLMITGESSGGSSQPTRSPFWVGVISQKPN